MNVTLGGDRLGAGKKQEQHLHDYQMSSFNLDQDWKSTMAPGILYPCLKLVGTNHGTFDIDMDQFIRTLPTNGPLFGSFKFQADIFCVPIRLYQGILHNNPIKIGLNMDKVYLPKIKLQTEDGKTASRVKGSNKYNYQIADNALLKYLGLSGIGTAMGRNGLIEPGHRTVTRKFNAVPVLAYYDIFKNYYANKQERDAYVIAPQEIQYIDAGEAKQFAKGTTWGGTEEYIETADVLIDKQVAINNNATIYLKYEYKDIQSPIDQIEIKTTLINANNQEAGNYSAVISDWIADGFANIEEKTDEYVIISIKTNNLQNLYTEYTTEGQTAIKNTIYVEQVLNNAIPLTTAGIQIIPFELQNIDTMRQRLLSNNFLGQEFVIDENTNLPPYSVLTSVDDNNITWNAYQMNGLLLKTYQSDLFNNWLNSTTIDEITRRTTMDTSQGFSMDQLNFMEKSYEVLTRIAITDGTYEDWQEAVYGEGAIRKAETPMYMGGMSAEVMFEEVIATTESNEGGEYQALGALGGKGLAVNRKGGNNIHIKCEEPCYIIGICSLTPRQAVCQGNDWDMTELNSLDDLHKPGFDGIGFQDLMIEQMAWWNTSFEVIEGQETMTRHSAGKQTAWINYQTAVDKIYGDFCDVNKSGYMVLNRNYERDEHRPGVTDLTTYIDPAKYNYAFSYAGLAAQNFWVQMHFKVVARRKMAAQQIPNL